MVTRHDFGRTKATGTAEPDLVKRLSGLSSPLTEERDLDPLIERLGNYVPTDLARRYDAMLYIDQATAVRCTSTWTPRRAAGHLPV